MTYFALCGLIGFFTGITCSAFILFHKPRTALKILWSLYSLGISFWGFGFFHLCTATNYDAALFWSRMLDLGAIFIPLFFFHIVVLLTSTFEQYKKTVIIYYLIFVCYFLIALCLPEYFIPSVSAKLNFLFYPNAAPVFYFFPFLFFYTLIHGWVVLYKAGQKASAIKRNQYKYFLYITAICFPGAATAFFPTFNIPISPFGIFLAPVHDIAVAYIIVKYNLMDINIIIRKSLIYSLLVTIITLIFLVAVLISEHLFHQIMHYQNITASIITASIIALIFTPLKNKIQSLVDRAFFKATPMEMADQNEKLKAVAILASGLAHEIKNPLTTLKTFAEYVPQKKDDPEFMEQYKKIMPQEISRIDNLVHELLLFAKPSPPKIQTVDPNEIISNIVLMLEQKFKSSNIQTVIQLNASISFQADPNQLKQALLNLILNAIDAMPNGGTLTIETSVIASEAKQSLIIKISDTGCGINPKDLPHIFEPFFTKKEKGTGLGLAITQGIIEKHAGKITVKSQSDQGTTFNIILPINHAS